MRNIMKMKDETKERQKTERGNQEKSEGSAACWEQKFPIGFTEKVVHLYTGCKDAGCIFILNPKMMQKCHVANGKKSYEFLIE